MSTRSDQGVWSAFVALSCLLLSGAVLAAPEGQNAPQASLPKKLGAKPGADEVEVAHVVLQRVSEGAFEQDLPASFVKTCALAKHSQGISDPGIDPAALSTLRQETTIDIYYAGNMVVTYSKMAYTQLLALLSKNYDVVTGDCGKTAHGLETQTDIAYYTPAGRCDYVAAKGKLAGMGCGYLKTHKPVSLSLPATPLFADGMEDGVKAGFATRERRGQVACYRPKIAGPDGIESEHCFDATPTLPFNESGGHLFPISSYAKVKSSGVVLYTMKRLLLEKSIVVASTLFKPPVEK